MTKEDIEIKKGEIMPQEKQKQSETDRLQELLTIQFAEKKTLESRLQELRNVEKQVYDKLQATGGAIQILQELKRRLTTGEGK